MLNQKKYQSWVVVLTAGLFFFFEYIKMTMFNSLSQALIKSFHVGAFKLATLSSYYFLSQIILLFPAGVLLDRYDVKRVITIVMLVSIVGTALFAAAPNYQVAVVARFISGVGGAFAFIACIRLASRWFTSSLFSTVTGLLITLALFGGFVSQTILAYLSDTLGWRQATYILAGFGVVVLLLIQINVKSAPDMEKEKREKQEAFSSFLRKLKRCFLSAQLYFAALYTALLNLPVFLIGSLWGDMYLEDTRHLGHIESALIVSMLFLGILVGSPFFGYLSDNVFKKRKPPMVLGSILSLCVVWVLMTSSTTNEFTLAILFLSLGFFSSAQCIGYPTIVENSPIELAATASGVGSILIMGVGVIAKLTFSKMLDAYWNGATQHHIPVYSLSAFNKALILLPLAFFVSLLFSLILNETNCENTGITR